MRSHPTERRTFFSILLAPILAPFCLMQKAGPPLGGVETEDGFDVFVGPRPAVQVDRRDLEEDPHTRQIVALKLGQWDIRANGAVLEFRYQGRLQNTIKARR